MKYSKILLLALCVLLQGCLFAPVIASFKKSGLTSGQRREQLPEAIEKFQQAIYWGDFRKALEGVRDDQERIVQQDLNVLFEGERFVDSKIKDVLFDPEVFEAQALVTLKHFDPATLVVKETSVIQNWEYDIGTGWSLIKLKTAPKGKNVMAQYNMPSARKPFMH